MPQFALPPKFLNSTFNVQLPRTGPQRSSKNRYRNFVHSVHSVHGSDRNRSVDGHGVSPIDVQNSLQEIDYVSMPMSAVNFTRSGNGKAHPRTRFRTIEHSSVTPCDNSKVPQLGVGKPQE